ncbi:MAG: hypothetical protein IKP28_05275 [Clostridia bacterium]|nr:hypothetical protein [Clostridia bacterium]
MKNKKVIYIVLLIVAIAGIIGLIVFFNGATENRDKIANTEVNLGNKVTTNTVAEKKQTTNTETKGTTITQQSDGTLYTVENGLEKVDIVIGDNLFDTQLSDINLNFSTYEGKTIEIEGMYMINAPYTFVGRYSTSNLCQYCPQGYSYFEYEWKGEKIPNLIDEIQWLKIKGILTQGSDEYGEYYYIDAKSIEVMNERGQDTVNN